MSKIEWTDKTWNPVTGCTMVSAGCINCYAMRMAARLESMRVPKYADTTTRTTQNGRAVWSGRINLDGKALSIPVCRRTPTRWFVNSMSDLFHEDVPFSFIDRVFSVMGVCPRHTFQILTKRPARMRRYLSGDRWRCVGDRTRTWPLPNVWLGVSCEDQATYDERVSVLMETDAALRFVSCEPLLANIDLRQEHFLRAPRGIDWMIVGGETGPGARQCSAAWISELVFDCVKTYTPVFVKQFGSHCDAPYITDHRGASVEEWPEELRLRQMPETNHANR